MPSDYRTLIGRRFTDHINEAAALKEVADLATIGIEVKAFRRNDNGKLERIV